LNGQGLREKESLSSSTTTEQEPTLRFKMQSPNQSMLLGCQHRNINFAGVILDKGKNFRANMCSILSSQAVVAACTEHTAYDILR
jgi:hypothetical protein